jgi:hypothetical protein
MKAFLLLLQYARWGYFFFTYTSTVEIKTPLGAPTVTFKVGVAIIVKVSTNPRLGTFQYPLSP